MAKGAYIEANLFKSKAYLSLAGAAPQVLMLLMLKRQFERAPEKKGQNKGKRVCVNADSLSLTYVEVKKEYGITQPRFTRAIDDLLAKGFITIKHPGGAYKRDKAFYALSDNYTSWRPGTIFGERKKDVVSRGFRKPKTTQADCQKSPANSEG